MLIFSGNFSSSISFLKNVRSHLTTRILFQREYEVTVQIVLMVKSCVTANA